MIHLPGEYKKILNEGYKQELSKKVQGIKLPCADHHQFKEPVIVQITEARDQVIQCPKCGRKHYLVWSKIQEHSKWQK